MDAVLYSMNVMLCSSTQKSLPSIHSYISTTKKLHSVKNILCLLTAGNLSVNKRTRLLRGRSPAPNQKNSPPQQKSPVRYTKTEENIFK
ncbi:MAG: hypothetical protein CL920_26040 [Deltaproteobacteria bacterium]|nr:hypothetical protein [Deltaproteobacteria bacterium]